MHLTLKGPPVSPERLAMAGKLALRFGLKRACSSRRRRDSAFKPNRRLAPERNLQF
jgi:hypothetical protein